MDQDSAATNPQMQSSWFSKVLPNLGDLQDSKNGLRLVQEWQWPASGSDSHDPEGDDQQI